MIISSYVQGFSQTVSIKKKPKKLFTVSALGVLNYMYVVSGKKKPELNRYKI